MKAKATCRWTEKGIWIAWGAHKRFERNQDGAVTVSEAVAAVGGTVNLLRRLIGKGVVKAWQRPEDQTTVVSVKDVRMLRTAWKYTGPTSRMAKRVA